MQKQHPQTAYCKYAILIGTIQAEGAFGQLKHNRSFKRFLTGGNIKVLAELLFLGLSQNIAHCVSKCNSSLQKQHLIQPKAYLKF